MTEYINEPWRSTWNSWENQHQHTLSEFFRIARTHFAHLLAARDNVQKAYTLFGKEGTIRPTQCNELIDLIKAVDKPVENFSQFLDQREHLPVVILPLRYQVMTELTCMKEHLWKAKALIGRFRVICQNGSREVTKQRYEILCKLELLLQCNEDIVQLSQVMFDQARFQERKDSRTADSPSCPQDYHSKSTQRNIYEFSSYHKRREIPKCLFS